MEHRGAIAAGMAGGMIWALALVLGAAYFVEIPVFTLIPTIMAAFLAPGLVLAAMIGRVAQRRVPEDAITGTQAPTRAAEIDRRVLADTVQQVVLALCVWPAAAVILGGAGPGVIMVLGLGLALSRIAFWIGCHVSPPLRAFGAAAGFWPTVLAALWALLSLSGLAGAG